MDNSLQTLLDYGGIGTNAPLDSSVQFIGTKNERDNPLRVWKPRSEINMDLDP